MTRRNGNERSLERSKEWSVNVGWEIEVDGDETDDLPPPGLQPLHFGMLLGTICGNKMFVILMVKICDGISDNKSLI